MATATDLPLNTDQRRLFELISVEVATLAGRIADRAVARLPSTQAEAAARAEALLKVAGRLAALTAALVALAETPTG